MIMATAGAVVLGAPVKAGDELENPYSVIPSRNAFHLQAPVPAPAPPKAPLPRIFLLGIVAGPGPAQVMLKTSSGTPGQETRLVLGLGERADNIEILDVDAARGLVQLNQEGESRILTTENDGLKPNASAPGPDGGKRFVPPVAPANALPPTASSASQEEQILRIEINRKLTQRQVDAGLMPPLPPTPITGQ